MKSKNKKRSLGLYCLHFNREKSKRDPQNYYTLLSILFHYALLVKPLDHAFSQRYSEDIYSLLFH